ncbi:pyrroloquinoline quinone biosynthesis protein B [Enhydrobacter aerosaccus]|uniref:Coenzyme PQQ synthesis protein B n=1 Tax=Enhydrobacter aerosaccus TaxID=225324 RepID=A0A1T4NVE3_9HYPH|nr:pyrroloquinoline quinone biosynthesis protein B [Enhydrobacter aerosaccus]
MINASPDLRQQIEAQPFIQPRQGLRSSPIEGVMLTGADVDAIAGLLHLRERQPFTVYGSDRVLAVLEANPIFDVLARDCVRRERVALNAPFEPRHVDGSACGLEVELFDVPGKVALYLERGSSPADLQGEPGDTVGVEVRARGERLIYIPGCAQVTERLKQRLAGASVVLFDGTLWEDDEMIRLGLGPKTGARMGHMSVSGDKGTMAAFRDIPVRRKIFVHINNSNPILLDDSVERRLVMKAGWEVAYDGMEVSP